MWVHNACTGGCLTVTETASPSAVSSAAVITGYAVLWFQFRSQLPSHVKLPSINASLLISDKVLLCVVGYCFMS